MREMKEKQIENVQYERESAAKYNKERIFGTKTN